MAETRYFRHIFASDAPELARKLQEFGEQLIDWRIIEQKPGKIDVIATIVQ
jgi:hypothetical protein